MDLILEKKGHIARYISLYLLPIGTLSFFWGMFFLTGRNEFKTVFYWAILAPVILTLLFEWRLIYAVKLSSIFKAALIFLLFACFSVFWSDTDRSFLHYLKRALYIFSFIMAFVCIYTYSPKRFIQTLMLACIGASVYAGYFLIQHYAIANAQLGTRITGSGVLYNPLLSAHVFGFYMAFLLALLIQMDWGWKKNSLVFILLMPVTVFVLMTHSRTPLLGLAFMLLAFLIINRNKKASFIFIACLTCGILIYFCYPEQFINRGLSYRPYIWSYSLGVYSQHPILGIGMDNSFAVPHPTSRNFAWAEPHNIHLSVLLRTGVIGFTLWLFLYWQIFKEMMLKSNSFLNRTLFLVIVFGSACALTEGGAFFSRPKEQWFIIWLPFALYIATQAGFALRQTTNFFINYDD